MESRVVVTAFIFTIIAACTKHEIEIQPFQRTLVAQEKKVKPSVFISEWETILAWTAEKHGDVAVFSYNRQFLQLNKSVVTNGVVLVFARNLWANDSSLKDLNNEPERPLMMPFYFLPYFEKPNYTEQWNYETEADRITISVIVKGSSDVTMPRKQIQLCYIIIPEQDLKEKKQTVKEVRKFSYEKVIKTFKPSS
jgi:hypothetical protein